jgi:streptomycin 6-kinase
VVAPAPRPIEVPELVRQRAMANAGGERWLRDLPAVVGVLAERWDLTIGAPYTGGTSGYVVAAVDGSRRKCVLKVALPLDWDDGEDFARSVLVHLLAEGQGCVELFDHDPARQAMLLDRLGPNLDEIGLPVPSILEAVASTLSTFWRPLPPEADLPTGAEKAEWLARHITSTWEELGRPCERAVIDRALACCESRGAAYDPDRSVLVHGDAHGWNTCASAAGDRTFKLVDPEGLRSEPAHDLAVPMREYNGPLLSGDTARLVRERAELLAGRCDVDPQAVWEWGYVERVSTGLTCMKELYGDEGQQFLEVAARSR